MALDAAALARYTGNRLVEDDQETQRNIDAAVEAARRYCGWHVTPVAEDDEVVLDGSGTPMLLLPTLRLVSVTAVSENGVELDVEDFALGYSSVGRPDGRLYKRSGSRWAAGHGNIRVIYTHGFESAPDWEAAVLSFADRMSQEPTGGRPVAIGPFRWPEERAGLGTAFSAVERNLLDLYALERSP